MYFHDYFGSRLPTWAVMLCKHVGVLALMRRMVTNKVTILMYHKVLPPSLAEQYPLRNLVINDDVFSQQIAFLATHCDVMPVRDAMALLDKGTDGSRLRPVVCVTFDDGYRDNFVHAAPVLEAHGLRGTFFVATGFVEGSPLWFDRAAFAWCRDPTRTARRVVDVMPELGDILVSNTSVQKWLGVLKSLPKDVRDHVLSTLEVSNLEPTDAFSPMAVREIQTLSARGHEIASHSVTHPILTLLDDATLNSELALSREKLRTWTGHDPVGICYPNGNHDERVMLAAVAAGYVYGCGVVRGNVGKVNKRMALQRRAILWGERAPNDIFGFECELLGLNDLLRHWKKRFLFGGSQAK